MIGSATAAALALLTGGLEVEEWSPPDAGLPEILAAAAPTPTRPELRAFGEAHAELGVNVRPDAAANGDDALARNLFELWGRASLGVDAKLSPTVRVLVEARAFWRGTTQPQFVRAKSTLEPQVGEAFLDWYLPSVDVRLGNQIVAFGANPLYAPSDQLNPRDFRWGFLQADPDVVKLPALAVRAQGEWGKVSWTAVYFPFFEPDRYDLFGANSALLQPTLGVHVPAVVSSSIEDGLQPHLLETQRPNAWPWLGDLGLRATAQRGKVKLGASWVWMNEKLPEFSLDPELQAFLTSGSQGRPVDPALALSLENRAQAGQPLASGFYQRQHTFSFEASTLVKSSQLDIDFAWSPEQTFITDTLGPVRKPSVTWVFGLSQAKDSPWIYNVTYLGLAVPNVKADELLVLIEPGTARGADRTAWLHLVLGSVGRRFWDERLEVSVRGGLDLIQGSGAVGPRISYKWGERVHVWAGAELYQGRALSLFGYFNRANQLLAGVDATLF